jgi:hypothetical protein
MSTSGRSIGPAGATAETREAQLDRRPSTRNPRARPRPSTLDLRLSTLHSAPPIPTLTLAQFPPPLPPTARGNRSAAAELSAHLTGPPGVISRCAALSPRRPRDAAAHKNPRRRRVAPLKHEIGNPKPEIRNNIPNPNRRKLQTPRCLVSDLPVWILGFVSDFAFHASDLRPLHSHAIFIRQRLISSTGFAMSKSRTRNNSEPYRFDCLELAVMYR